MTESGAAPDLNAVQVCVRVRPINERERNEGHRTCVTFDEPTKQVVLTAVDRNTLLKLSGATAKGYAFDKRYPQDSTSDDIYTDCIAQLVESCFKGYNATVLAYGQTGSGKTHTMSGGVGIHGKVEEGITPRVIRHLFSIVEQLNSKAKPGEKIEVSATALELYNEDLLDLSFKSGREEAHRNGWDTKAGAGLKLQERPVGKDGRVIPEVIGLREVKVASGEELHRFYTDCMENRSVSSTKLNDTSSRSHAIFTITISRTTVEVLNELGDDLRARVRTCELSAKLHLVDLAGSERVKKSGVKGKELKEATHINSGLLALGNVIVALSNEAETKKKAHVPYRDSKLTRLLQDSLGGNSLTVLISCISPSEMDFEETNNTLKYANRACAIKNTPLPVKFTQLEEDLLPSLPMGTGPMGLAQLKSVLENHEQLKAARERREREKAEKMARLAVEREKVKEEQAKRPGFQRVRASQYDELRRQLAARGATNIPAGQVIGDESLVSFGRNNRLTASVDGPLTPMSALRSSQRGSVRHTFLRRTAASSTGGRAPSVRQAGQSFDDWLAAQQAAGEDPGVEQEYDPDGTNGASAFIVEDYVVTQDEHHHHHPMPEDALPSPGQEEISPETFLVDDDEQEDLVAAQQQLLQQQQANAVASAGSMEAGESAISKAKFRRAAPAAAVPLVTEETDVQQRLSEMGIEPISTEPELDEVEEELPYDPISDVATPKLLARFKVNTSDVLSVYKAVSKEDFQDVISLLPANTPLPASDKMTYLLARLECVQSGEVESRLARVATGETTMNEAVGPAVGCLMATFGTNMISSCIFEFPDPEELRHFDVEERIELWGLQIPHNSVRPQLVEGDAQQEGEGTTITWTSVDRLNMSIGLLYALCNNAIDSGVRCGFCVPRPQLLKRWLQAGVRMRQITGDLQLIYPPSAHDYEYYKASTVAYFMIDEVRDALSKVLAIMTSDS